MTAFSTTWDASFEASPADGDDASLGASKIRQEKLAVRERIAVDHSIAGTVDDGAHKKVTLLEQAGNPTSAANTGFLYTKDVSAITELFWEDSSGTVLQLTSAGKISPTALIALSALLTITVTAVGNPLFEAVSTDAGAAVGPSFSAYRNSASPAASDSMGLYDFFGKDSAGNKQEYAYMSAGILDPTSTSEDGFINWGTVVAGTIADRVRVAQGLYTAGVSGGDKGVDTINATTYYQSGQPLLQPSALVNSAGVLDLTGSSAYNGIAVFFTAGGGSTITLPVGGGSIFRGYRVGVFNDSAGIVTVNPGAGGTISSKGSASLSTLLLPTKGDGGWFVYDGTSKWVFWGKRSFSQDIACTVSTETAAPHFLGVDPDHIRIKLVCTVDNLGYTASTDILAIDSGSYVMLVDATNINFKTATVTTSIPQKSTHTLTAITAADWNYRIIATVRD